MSDFKNPHQTGTNPASFNAVPYVRYMWVCETTQNVGPHSNYVPSGYQQPAQTMYPFNMLHNSPVFASPDNLNQRPQAFPQSFQTQNAFWTPSNAVFQSAPNMTSPVTVTGYLVADPRFIQNNVGNQEDELRTNTMDITNRMFPPTNVTSQAVSFGLVNGDHQPEQIWPQQQHDTSRPVSFGLVTCDHQPEQICLQQQHDTLLQIQKNEQEQQEQPEIPLKHLDHRSRSETITYHVTHNSSENATEKDDDRSINANISDDMPESVQIASWQDASAGTYLRGSGDPRPNTLPSSFPTTLNPSLQIKSPSRLREPVPLQKAQTDEKISGSSMVTETKVKDQDGPHESEIQLRRKNSQRSIVKPVYAKPRNRDDCIRCNTKVYPMERTGPIKDVVYHKRCFTCVSCGTTLTLNNFHHNPNESDDLRVFCASHKPKERTNSCDASAVLIRSALTAPKLDKINGQIRTDRHPSEVLARSGYVQPTASARNATQECFYYGMEVTENTTSETSQKENPQDYPENEHLQKERHQRFQQQQVNDQLDQQPQHEEQHLQNREQAAQQQYKLQDLLEQNIQLQQGIVDNDRKLADDIVNVTISGNDKTPTTLTDIHADDVFLPTDQNIIAAENDNKDKQCSTLQQSPSSSMRQQQINSGNNFDSNLTTNIKLDNYNALQQQTQDMRNTDEDKKLIARDRLSSQSSMSTSSESISPMQVHTSSSFLDKDGHRSSFSSDLSSRERSSFSSDLSSHESSSSSSDMSYRERMDMEALAKPYPGDQITLSTHGLRADRPSILQYYHGHEIQRQQSPSGRMIEKSGTNYTLGTPRSGADLDRFLPRNECMRLDRPSQYSREAN